MTSHTALTQFTRTAERAANQVISGYSTSFKLATRLLDANHRQHVRNIYALVRVADEIVDGLATEAGLSHTEQADALERFVNETHLAMRLGYSSDLVIHAFARTARQVGIDEQLTVPFFDSMRTDLPAEEAESTAPQNFDSSDHATYVFGSAEVVGLMCLRVFLHGRDVSPETDQKTQYGARQLGAAFQNVSFLRDLRDDSERLGRNYLGDGKRLTDADRIAWVRQIREELAHANAAVPLLPRDARAAVRSASALFTALTDRIEATPIDDLYQRRVRVPDPVKIALTFRSILTTWLEPRA